MIKITGRQSKSARALLKWNIPDLATRCKLRSARVTSFENGLLQLQGWEMQELMDAYKGHGIIFSSDLSVHLQSKNAKTVHEQIHTIDLNDSEDRKIIIDDLSTLSDRNAIKAAKEEIEKRKSSGKSAT